jgi:hypothetical protein
VIHAVRSQPAESSRHALAALGHQLSEQCTDEPPDSAASQASGSLLGLVVDIFVGSRRLSCWALWLQLAAVAQLVARWQASPPIVEGAFPEPHDTGSPPGAGRALVATGR